MAANYSLVCDGMKILCRNLDFAQLGAAVKLRSGGSTKPASAVGKEDGEASSVGGGTSVVDGEGGASDGASVSGGGAGEASPPSSFQEGYVSIIVQEILAQAPLLLQFNFSKEKNIGALPLVPYILSVKPQENGDVITEVRAAMNVSSSMPMTLYTMTSNVDLSLHTRHLGGGNGREGRGRQPDYITITPLQHATKHAAAAVPPHPASGHARRHGPSPQHGLLQHVVQPRGEQHHLVYAGSGAEEQGRQGGQRSGSWRKRNLWTGWE